MDVGRLVYDLTRAYVYGLVLASAATILWLWRATGGATTSLAGIWFAVGGFGALVLLTILLVQYSR